MGLGRDPAGAWIRLKGTILMGRRTYVLYTDFFFSFRNVLLQK